MWGVYPQLSCSPEWWGWGSDFQKSFLLAWLCCTWLCCGAPSGCLPPKQQQLLPSQYLPSCALPVHGTVSTAPVQSRYVFISLLVVRPLDGP